MTEIVRKRSSKWDVVPEISVLTGDEQDSNNHCEKTGDNNHEKNSNLELIDSNNSTSGAIKWSNVGPTDMEVSKDSGWSNWDLGNENRDGGNISSTMKTWGGETSIPTGDQQDVNNHCEKTGDAKHEKISNLELINSKNSASEAINWSNVGPKDTEVSKDSGLSNLDLGNENRDGGDISSTMKTWGEETSIPTGDQQVDNSHCEKTGDTMHDKHSNLELSDSKHSTSEAMKWSNVGPKDTTVSKDSGWSNWDAGNENRGGGDISSTVKTWGGDQRSISPGPDSWSRSRSRSPKREWSRSHRSRSPSHSWNRDKDGWKDRSRRGSQETYGHDGGRRSNSGPIEIRGGRQERGGPVGHIGDDISADFQRQGGYSGDRPFHGERKRQEPERESNRPCFDFRKGRCHRGSACRYVHESSSTDGYGDKVARERAHDRHDLALPSENRRRRDLPACKFFPQGQCRNGASCPFPHLAPGNESQWGLRPDNGNNLEGVQNRRWQDASMENALRSPKWRYDASRRVGTHDSNRDHHSSYMGREGSRQIQEDLPPWNPPQTYHTLPNKPPEFPIPIGKQDTSRGFPDPHQLVSNYNTAMTVNSGGINSSASNLPSMATGPTPNFNLNEQSQQMGSQVPSNPQFTMQMDMGRAITKPDVSDPNSIHITAAAAIAQNLVTSEQVSQVKNISASLAQIIATGQQLPQLYASLNPPPAPGFMPSHAFSHPNFTRPLTPMGAELVQTNTGIWPQSKPYDSVSDNIKSGNPPGFALGLAVQQNASTEESLKPIKSLDLFPETGGFDYDPKKNCETEEKGNYNNENHEPLQPEMNRDTGAKEINEVGGDGAMEQETGLSKETGQLEDESVKGKEAKAMRMFKFALVEFVKEMLKPTWREGQMSKEAHKTIVKKVVDKVTGALQGPQIPQTQEKIDQYLMFSKAKLEKLVQAYVEKYLKI